LILANSPFNGEYFTMYRRNLHESVLAGLNDTPVVLINGARQSGKSTLVQQIGRELGALSTYLTLDDATVLSAAAQDPEGWLRNASGALIIDEVQKVPELFPAIKMDVDRDRRPGRFLLTGSANVLLLPKISESLAGRMEICTLWPLSQGELAGVTETFIDRLFAGSGFAIAQVAAMDPGLPERIAKGGFPEVLTRQEEDRQQAWFNAYITTLLQRDVRDLANIEGLTAMPRLLMLLAGRVGGLLNVADLTRSLTLPHSTLTRYLSLLELVFLVRRVPAWSVNLGKRLVKAPKLYLCDTGLAAHLAGMTADRWHRDPSTLGPLLENFVALELLKQSGWAKTRVALYHYRTASGQEVDFLLEGPGGVVAGVEVKAGSQVQASDFSAMRSLAHELGSRFVAGVVLYRGEQVIPFASNLAALPVQELWRGT
jgi:predicted AAA+ superfamily ATPase